MITNIIKYESIPEQVLQVYYIFEFPCNLFLSISILIFVFSTSIYFLLKTGVKKTFAININMAIMWFILACRKAVTRIYADVQAIQFMFFSNKIY